MQKRSLFCWIAVSCFFLSGCASAPGTASTYLKGRGLSAPHSEHFQHCRGYGCKYKIDLSLTNDDWKTLSALFMPPPANPEIERASIAKAIGTFESILGPRAGSETDHHGTFETMGDDQQDCVDESTNTTTYLLLLQGRGLLKFHSVKGPTMRVPILHAGTWPHQTAVIREETGGALYAVDSWFHNNGQPAEIIALRRWMGGWEPEKR